MYIKTKAGPVNNRARFCCISKSTENSSIVVLNTLSLRDILAENPFVVLIIRRISMELDWMDDLLGESAASSEDTLGTFYCPYTNNAECALLSKGWQPQELCEGLECEQLKAFKRIKRRGHAA